MVINVYCSKLNMSRCESDRNGREKAERVGYLAKRISRATIRRTAGATGGVAQGVRDSLDPAESDVWAVFLGRELQRPRDGSGGEQRTRGSGETTGSGHTVRPTLVAG